MLYVTLVHRSADLETKGDVSLPSYRGDIINGPEFTEQARIPDPWRLVRAYNQSAATLNLLRGFSTGGYAGALHGGSDGHNSRMRSNVGEQ
jgi:3-deoxy-D-arabino-heptulosonate 7-phosphate (DAHP) synthase class II